jgi:hypothetical protein
MNKAKQKRRPRIDWTGEPPISPVVSSEYRSAARRLWAFFGLFGLIMSGMNPGPGDPKAWYDRAIRVVGGILILLVLGGALVVTIMESFSKR